MSIYNYLCFRLVILGFFIVTGLSITNAQNCDFAFSLTGADDFNVHSLALTSNGHILVVGSFKGSNVDFDPGINLELRNSPESTNSFIASYTAEGALNWVQTMGGDANLIFTDITVDGTGKIYVCGWCRGTNVDLDPGEANSNHRIAANTTGMVVAYYSANGTYRWGFIVPAEYNPAFQSSVMANKITLDDNGNIFICGTFQTSRVDLDPGLGMSTYSTANTGSLNNYDAFIAKYDKNGVYIWSSAIQSNDFDMASSVATDKDGNAYLCGSFSGTNTNFSSGSNSLILSSLGASDIFISKYDANGNIIWAKNMGGPDNDQATDVKLDNQGNIVVTGTYRGSANMGDNVNPAWLISMGDADCFFTKHNSNGELLFAKSMGSEEFDSPNQLAINIQNELFITGLYNARADNDFDPGEGIKKLKSDELNNYNYLFAGNFSVEGSLNWATSGTSTSGISGTSILPISEKRVVVSGKFNSSGGNAVFLGDNDYLLSTNGKSGIFLATFSTVTGSQIKSKPDQNIRVYPNPVTNRINLELAEAYGGELCYQAQLFSSTGSLLLTVNGNMTQIEFELNQIIGSLSRDYYFIRFAGDKIKATTGFLKL